LGPIPNPQSPIPNPQFNIIIKSLTIIYLLINKINKMQNETYDEQESKKFEKINNMK